MPLNSRALRVVAPCVVVVLALSDGTGHAKAYVRLTPQDRQVLEDTIASSMNNRSGTAVPWYGSGDISGRVTPQPAFNRDTHERCGSGPCENPCRDIDYTIVTPKAFAEYTGTRCLQNSVWARTGADRLRHSGLLAPAETSENRPGNSAEQSKLEPNPASELPPPGDVFPAPVAPALPIQTNTSPPPQPSLPPSLPPPPIATDIVRQIQTELRTLLYYRGEVSGMFDPRTATALTEFIGDERSALELRADDDVLALLKQAEARITLRRCEGMASMGNPYRACGTALK